MKTTTRIVENIEELGSKIPLEIGKTKKLADTANRTIATTYMAEKPERNVKTPINEIASINEAIIISPLVLGQISGYGLDGDAVSEYGGQVMEKKVTPRCISIELTDE